MSEQDAFIQEIAPDVLKVLTQKRFFEALDERLCPKDPTPQPAICHGDYLHSREILTQLAFDSTEIDEVLQVLASQGGSCDCEVLYNVAGESRLKSRYWKARHADITAQAAQRNPPE